MRIAPTPRPAAASPLPRAKTLRVTRDSRLRSLREHEPGSGLWFYPALSALRRTRDSRLRSLREHEPGSGLGTTPSIVIPDA